MQTTEVELKVFTTLYALVILASLVGNTLLIYVVWKKIEVRSLTSFMFVNMAVADLLVTLVAMTWSIAIFYTEGKWLIEGAPGEITCRSVAFIAWVTPLASILCLSFTAVDRFYAVVHPFRLQVWFRNAKTLTPLIWIMSILFMSVILVTHRIDASNSTCIFDFKIWGENELSAIRGIFLYIFLVTYFFPLCITSILYGKTAHALWVHSTPGDETIQNHRQRQHEITKRKVVRNLIIIFTVFALCWLPAQVYHLFLAITAWQVSVKPIVMYLVYWLGHANSAINPWLYITLNSKMNTQVVLMTKRNLHLGNASVRQSQKRHGTHDQLKETHV